MEKDLTKKEKWQAIHLGIPLLFLCSINADSSPIGVVFFLLAWFIVASLPYIRKALNENRTKL